MQFPQQKRGLGNPVARWAGEGKDWVQEMAECQLAKHVLKKVGSPSKNKKIGSNVSSDTQEGRRDPSGY